MKEISKIDSNKSALIIQGPILSKGRSGKNFGDSDLPVDEISIDCSSSINDVILRFGESYDLIIISTWESEETSGIMKSDKIIILKLKVPRHRVSNKKEPNTFRQFYSISRALDLAKFYNCELIVKIRTDTWIDAGKLLNLVKTIPNKIWVSPFASPNLLSDFFIGGHIKNVQHITRIILRYDFFSRSIHYQLFYRYAYFQNTFWEKIYFWHYFPNPLYLTRAQARLIRVSWERYFSAIPQEIYNNMLWRGFGIPEESQRSDRELNEKFETWTELKITNSKSLTYRFYFIAIAIHKLIIFFRYIKNRFT